MITIFDTQYVFYEMEGLDSDLLISYNLLFTPDVCLRFTLDRKSPVFFAPFLLGISYNLSDQATTAATFWSFEPHFKIFRFFSPEVSLDFSQQKRWLEPLQISSTYYLFTYFSISYYI